MDKLEIGVKREVFWAVWGVCWMEIDDFQLFCPKY
jgi:hypothetical protein